MIIAVYELNGKVLKTANLTKKLKKVKPDKILYQTEFTGSTKDAERILDDWLRSPYNGNYLRADTIWDAIAGLWELQGNPTKNFINNTKQPDYTKTV